MPVLRFSVRAARLAAAAAAAGALLLGAALPLEQARACDSSDPRCIPTPQYRSGGAYRSSTVQRSSGGGGGGVINYGGMAGGVGMILQGINTMAGAAGQGGNPVCQAALDRSNAAANRANYAYGAKFRELLGRDVGPGSRYNLPEECPQTLKLLRWRLAEERALLPYQADVDAKCASTVSTSGLGPSGMSNNSSAAHLVTMIQSDLETNTRLCSGARSASPGPAAAPPAPVAAGFQVPGLLGLLQPANAVAAPPAARDTPDCLARFAFRGSYGKYQPVNDCNGPVTFDYIDPVRSYDRKPLSGETLLGARRRGQVGNRGQGELVFTDGPRPILVRVCDVQQHCYNAPSDSAAKTAAAAPAAATPSRNPSPNAAAPAPAKSTDQDDWQRMWKKDLNSGK